MPLCEKYRILIRSQRGLMHGRRGVCKRIMCFQTLKGTVNCFLSNKVTVIQSLFVVHVNRFRHFSMNSVGIIAHHYPKYVAAFNEKTSEKIYIIQYSTNYLQLSYEIILH